MKKQLSNSSIRRLNAGKKSLMSRAVVAVVLLVFMASPSLLRAQGTNISFPGFRSSYITGTELTIMATANAVTGTTITKVEFLIGSAAASPIPPPTTVLGEVLTPPYNYTWTIPAGQPSYNELRTRVTYASGVTAVSSLVPIDVYEPDFSSNVNYYVGPLGNNNNTGTDPSTPFLTLQAGMQVAKPGDVVNVMAGTYSVNNNNVVSFRRTGTPTAWVTLKNYQNDRPIISANGPNAIVVTPNVAYARIQGLEIVGSNQNEPLSVTLPKAYTQAGSCAGPTGTPPNIYNTNGISVDGTRADRLHPHHIEIRDNIVHDCGGSGISAIQADYITVENNTVYNNSWFTVYGTSGISFLNSWNLDGHTGSTPTMIVRNNRCYNNRLYVRWRNGSQNTCRTYDGNGIILDNNKFKDPSNGTTTKNPLGDYTGRFLVENNLSYKNGGRGININFTDNVTILNNTTYQNGATNTVNSPSTGEVTDDIDNELIVQGSKDISVYNNIFHGRPGERVTAVNSSTVVQNNNLTYEGTGAPFFTGGQNITGQNPLFANAENGNFQLLSTSPAINAGSNTAGQFSNTDILGIARPQGAGVDMGAYELQGTPISITQQPASGSAVCEGADIAISVSVSGTVRTYQWYKDGNALTGVTSATTATLSLSGVTSADAGSYSVVVTGFNSLTSSIFSLSISGPPTNPSLTSGTLTCANTSATLTASATGGSSYTLSDGQSNATGQFVVSTAGNYSVIVANATGCTATATATVESSTTTPQASLSASSLTACSSSIGTPTGITLTAGTGTGYAFSGPGLNQSGAGNTAIVTQSGTYSVVVSNAQGCTATASVSITISQSPAAPTLTNMSRTVDASATPLPLTQFVNATNGNTLSFSGTSGLLAPPTVSISQAGIQSFSVTQTNVSGCISLPMLFTITVQQPNTIDQPESQTVCRSSGVVLTVDVAGATAFEWYKNGTSAPFKLTEIASIQRGTKTASLTLVSIQTSANYYCKVARPSGITIVGPLRVVVNFSCIASGARQAASDEPDSPLAVQLLPNPVTDGQLRARVDGATGKRLMAQLLDTKGQVVHQQEWPRAEAGQLVDCNISQRADGLYLLMVQIPGRMTTIKVIKAD